MLSFFYADIIKECDFKKIQETVEKADKDTLVIFDVDDVLITALPEFSFHSSLRKKLKKNLKTRYPRKDIEILFSHFFKKRKCKLLHQEMTKILQDLKEKGIKCIALTGWWTGRYGDISHIEHLRFKGLKEAGISFIGMSPFEKDAWLSEVKKGEKVPLIRDGVVLCASSPKGDVLRAALKKTSYKFKKIIFIDDQLDCLESAQKACDALKIPFVGLQDTSVERSPELVLDEKKEALRFNILEKEKIWLTDDEIEARLSLPFGKNIFGRS